VENPGVLKPGFFAEVSLPSDSKKDAIVVPETAIQASDRGFIAFAIIDGKVAVRPVELGPRTGGGYVEILTGLAAGEIIVYEGSDRITNGTTVTTGGGAPGGAGPPRGGAGGSNKGGASDTNPGGSR
jgi:multidrug efflux system membrane fusion protein